MNWLLADRVGGVALVLIGAGAAYLAVTQLPVGTLHNPGPAYAPLLLAGLLMALGLAVAATGAGSRALAQVGWSEWPHAMRVLAVAAVATLALERIGYRLTMLALFLILVGVVERRPLLWTLGVSAGLAFGSYYLFAVLLKIPLPIGPGGI